MNQQVITVQPDGSISGLQRKAGKGVDLRQFGHATIERVSEITWDEDRQRWVVNIISGPMAGTLLKWAVWRGAGFTTIPEGCQVRTGSGDMTFENYDDAVATEVAFLDMLRKRGVF